MEDLLVEMAASIEPDGGAPGGDSEQRIAATLLLLLLFMASGHSASQGAFAAHVRRLTAFLKRAELGGLGEHRDNLVRALLIQLDESEPIRGSWEACARDYAKNQRKWSSEPFWQAATSAIATDRPA